MLRHAFHKEGTEDTNAETKNKADFHNQAVEG